MGRFGSRARADRQNLTGNHTNLMSNMQGTTETCTTQAKSIKLINLTGNHTNLMSNMQGTTETCTTQAKSIKLMKHSFGQKRDTCIKVTG